MLEATSLIASVEMLPAFIFAGFSGYAGYIAFFNMATLLSSPPL